MNDATSGLAPHPGPPASPIGAASPAVTASPSLAPSPDIRASGEGEPSAGSSAGPGSASPALAALLASAVFVVPLLLSRSTTPTPNHPRVFFWYLLLRKPSFKPPDVAIPIAWTLIEAALATAAFRLLRRRATPSRNRALGWLAVNVAGIGAWSRLFFGGRSLPASTVAAAALAGTGAAYIAQARKADPTSAAAAIPYVAWVAFATVLTAAMWRRNR